MPSPYEQIYREVKKYQPDLNFSDLVSWYLCNGLVFSTAEFFLMAKVITHKEPNDTWFLEAASGNMAKMWSIMPYPLPYLAFTRVNDPIKELKFFPMAVVARLCPPDLTHEPSQPIPTMAR